MGETRWGWLWQISIFLMPALPPVSERPDMHATLTSYHHDVWITNLPSSRSWSCWRSPSSSREPPQSENKQDEIQPAHLVPTRSSAGLIMPASNGQTHGKGKENKQKSVVARRIEPTTPPTVDIHTAFALPHGCGDITSSITASRQLSGAAPNPG